MDVAKADPGANLEKVRSFAARARAEGATLLLLPEMWTCGFAYREMPKVAEGTPDHLAELGRIAAEHALVIAGSMPELEKDRLYNTLFVVDADGRVRAAYRKVHLFPLFKEHSYLQAGTKPVNVSLLETNIGLAVCFDLRFPEFFRKLALRGARIILLSAEWPRERLDHWKTLVTARSVENQIFVVAANSAGRHGRTVFAGHSLVVDPSGRVLAEGGEGEELVSAEVDLAEVDKVRGVIDYLSCRVKDTDEFLNLY